MPGIPINGLQILPYLQPNEYVPWGQLGTFLAFAGGGNMLYWDPIYARARGFEVVILPSGILGGMISDLLDTKLLGGTNWLKQRFDF